MEMCNRCLEQNTNLTIKGKKRKHFTDVVKNMVFSQTVKNIHLSVVLRIEFFFCAEREKKNVILSKCTKWQHIWEYNAHHTFINEQLQSLINMASQHANLQLWVHLFWENSTYFGFFFNTKYFWKYTVIYNTYVFWSCFLLSTFQILIFLKSILYTAKYKKKSPKEDCLPLSVKHQILKHNIRAITKKLADTAILTRVTWISQMFFLCSKRIRGNNWEST